MNAAARFDESASATGSSMRPRGLFDGPFRAGPAQARPARAGRVGGTTGRDSRHGPALSSGRASPALMISCWAVFWAPVFGPCSGWPSWARPIFPALPHHFLPADPPALRAIPGTSARGDRAGELGRRVTVGVGAEPPTCRRAAAPPPAEERGRRRTTPCGPQGRATFSIASLSSAAVVVIAGAIWLPIVGVDPKISFRG